MKRCLSKIFNTRRAALCGLIGAISVSVGCQASLRPYRQDQPRLRELAASPESRAAEHRDSPAQAAAQPGGSGDRYSTRPRERYDSDADDRRADDRRTDDRRSPDSAKASGNARPLSSQDAGRWDPPSEADEAAYLQGLPPELWPLARQQFLASYQYNQRRTAQNRAQLDDQDARHQQLSDRQGDAPELEAAEPDLADRRAIARGSGAAGYRMRDDQGAADARAPESNSLDPHEPETARLSGGRQTASSRPKARAATGAAAHYQLRDDEGSSVDAAASERSSYAGADADSGEDHLPPARPRREAAELRPPSSRKSSRQVAHVEPIDTGAGDDVRVMPPYDRHASPTRSTEPAQYADSAQYAEPAPYASRARRDAAQAASGPEAAQSSVVPASATQPIQRRPVEAVQPAVDESSQAFPLPKKALSSQDHLQAALRALDEEWTDQLTPSEQLQHQAVKRLLLLANGQLEGAMEPIEALEAHEQEFFRHCLQAWHHAIDPTGNPVMARRWPLVLNSHREAAAQLAAISPLEVKNAAFCSNVEGFGSITKFPATQFRAGQELLLYCEIDNFVSEPVKEGFETKLQGSYEIVDASSNVKVAEVLLPQDVEICKRARRDYFLVYRLYMPTKIAAGRYQLRLTIEDMKGKKFGQSSLDFQVGT